MLDIVETGMCASCRLEERSLARGDPETLGRARQYDVRAVPTTVIDGRIKVEGRPDFPWVCGDEFYVMLERKYPLRRGAGTTE